MSYLDQCRACDDGDHGKCDGTVTVIDQDGHSRYICQCMCRRWEARCPEPCGWSSGGHYVHRQEAVEAFDRHVRDMHWPDPILTQPNRGVRA